MTVLSLRMMSPNGHKGMWLLDKNAHLEQILLHLLPGPRHPWRPGSVGNAPTTDAATSICLSIETWLWNLDLLKLGPHHVATIDFLRLLN